MPIAIKNDKADLSSEKQTEELALKFLNKLKPGNKVFLYGEMGVGKTTFVRYLINGFQKKNKLILTEVTSPTFNLLSEYSINNLTIKHYDLYRLKNEMELDSLGLFEEEPDTITLVEWPEIIKRDLKNLVKLYFSYENDYQKRFVQMSSPSYLCNLADNVPFLKTETIDLANVLKYVRLANKKIQCFDLQKRK